MRNFITRALKDESLVGTVFVTVALLANGFFSYLLQVFLGRSFTVSDFGTYNALLSLFTVLIVPISALSMSLIKVVSELVGHQKSEKLAQLFWVSLLFLFFIGLSYIALLYLIRNPLADYMNIQDSMLYFFLGTYIFANLLNVGPQAFLQGLMRFKAFSFYVASVGLVRLIVPLILVFMGYKVGGIYVGLALSMLLSFLIGFAILKKDLVRGNKEDLSEEYKKIISLALPVLLLNLGMISLNNIDVILVKKYFDAETAGYYAGVVILGKLILFGVGSVTVVMFPQVSALVSSGKDYMSRFKFFLKMLLIILSGAVIVFSLVPSLIARIFFGEQLLASAQYLPMFSVFISIYVLVNFLLMFFVAVNRTKTFLVLIPAVILQFVAINIFHNSIFTIIGINLSIIFLVLATLGIYLYKISSKTAH